MINYSYLDIAEKGIAVCASCGGANINSNWKIKIDSLPMGWCFDCCYNEGVSVCMPNDKNFYSIAKKTVNKLNKNKIIKIEVSGGVVQEVSNLPNGYDYEIIDYDHIEAMENEKGKI